MHVDRVGQPGTIMSGDWNEELAQHRREKDEYLAEHPQSPLPPGERADFEGLEYFPPDPDLRFELPLHEHDGTETIVVETTAEGEREYLRWGEFRFSVDGEDATLQAYKADPGEDRLWVPFRDATSGEETYGAGRYLDLAADRDRTDDGTWILDFNLAYSPFCAYSPQFECPLVPMDNWLDVPIRAGEKTYDGPGAGPDHGEA